MRKAVLLLLPALLLLAVAPAHARRGPYSGWKAEVEYKLGTGDFPGAMTLLKSAEAAGNIDADYYFLLGKASSSLGNLDESLAHLDKAVQMDPTFAEAKGHKAIVLLQKGKAKEAEAAADEAIRIESTGELHFARGAIRMALGRFKDAIADLDAAIGLEPKNDEYYVARGEVALRVGRVDSAERDYARAIEINPKNAKAFLGRGGLMLVKRDFASAAIDLDHCVNLAPKFSSCYLRRGKLFQMRGKPDRAYKDFVRATELAPNATEVWFERVMAELELNKFGEAEKSASNASWPNSNWTSSARPKRPRETSAGLKNRHGRTRSWAWSSPRAAKRMKPSRRLPPRSRPTPRTSNPISFAQTLMPFRTTSTKPLPTSTRQSPWSPATWIRKGPRSI